MTETQQLIARIHDVAKRTNRAPSTLSAQLLGSGKSLSELEAGRTITLAKYERAMAMLSEIETDLEKAA